MKEREREREKKKAETQMIGEGGEEGGDTLGLWTFNTEQTREEQRWETEKDPPSKLELTQERRGITWPTWKKESEEGKI